MSNLFLKIPLTNAQQFLRMSRAGGGGREIFPTPTDKKFRGVRWNHLLALDLLLLFH